MTRFSLTKYEVVLREQGDVHSWPLRIVCEAPDGDVSPKIFVWRRNLGLPNMPYDVYQCVASVQQFWDLPEDEPLPDADPPVMDYRTAELQVDCRTPEQAELIWKVVQEDAKVLAEALSAYERIEAIETVVVEA